MHIYINHKHRQLSTDWVMIKAKMRAIHAELLYWNVSECTQQAQPLASSLSQLIKSERILKIT